MNSEQITVKCEIPFLIRTDNPETDDFQFFSVPDDEYVAEVGFRMAPGGGKGNITTAGSADEDRLGHMSTTHVQVKLGEDFIGSIPDTLHSLPDSLVFRMGSSGDDESTYIAEETTKQINKFLRVYRSETDSYWMRNLLPHDIFDFIIVHIGENGEESEQHHKHTAGAMTGMGSTLSDDTISHIQTRLTNQDMPSIFTQLQLAIRDQISLGEYSVAVVNSQRLVETWLKEAFEYLLMSAEGYSQSEAEQIARHSDGQFKDIHDIWNMYRSQLGYDLESTSEFQQWDDISYELRKNIVHEGYEPTEREAVNAVQLNDDLLALVKSEFEDDLRTDLAAIKKSPDDGIGRTTIGDSKSQ